MTNKEKIDIDEKNEKEKPFWQELIGYILLIVIVIVIKKYVISPIRVNGISMVPTLEDSDYMLLNKFKYNVSSIERFDIVVIDCDNDYIIKRIIGLPGETIEYKDNKLYVNGKYVAEDYTREVMPDYNIKEIGSKTVPKGQYFVLGDNRPVSKDSRYLGFIPKDEIIGKSTVTLFPVSRFGIKK